MTVPIKCLRVAVFTPYIKSTTANFSGTYLTNGLPVNPSACVTGLDQVGFVMGYMLEFSNAIFTLTDGSFGFDARDEVVDDMNIIFD